MFGNNNRKFLESTCEAMRSQAVFSQKSHIIDHNMNLLRTLYFLFTLYNHFLYRYLIKWRRRVTNICDCDKDQITSNVR